MTSPMFELPEHVWIPCNADGEGPELVEPDHYECWCGTPGCEAAEGERPEVNR